ncbi:energy transducer TonB [Lysobacter antibioticus]|uniref:TonB family C-terminal domain protein n=1 Tax=Lysobacter antibioticus TaxID=84531 RepID=A0A0S2FI44_LYSAN|nr:energy transducer TonB [Lysobacter antibioticus]ALN83175.1 tonB family C-terminal domain protein [Lysobacter antibioticus]
MKPAGWAALLGALVLFAADAAAQDMASYDATVDQASKLRHRPAYPREAIKACVSGTVVMIIDVAADGSFIEAVVEKSSRNAHLDRAALEAARHWKYYPASDEKGARVADRIRIPIDFEEHESCWTRLVPDTPARPEPSSMTDPRPHWPSVVAEKALSGEVVLLMLLDEEGSTHSARVETSSGDPAIDAAAKYAAMNWKYLPAMLNGKPVRSILRLPILYGQGTSAASR